MQVSTEKINVAFLKVLGNVDYMNLAKRGNYVIFIVWEATEYTVIYTLYTVWA